MAVAWLDAARYADSYGYQSDQLNTQWPLSRLGRSGNQYQPALRQVFNLATCGRSIAQRNCRSKTGNGVQPLASNDE